MNEKTKESKFLDAINRYAEKQKAQINQEIEDYKNSKIEQATEQGLKDAYDLIRDDISKQKAAIVNDTARRELEMRNNLFSQRESIIKKVFEEAREKLIAFTESDAYSGYIEDSAKEIAALFGNEPCKVSIAPKDEALGDIIKKHLPNAVIKTDNHIAIGGIKAYCESRGVMADDTLDAGLDEQREWFIENAGLKVV